MVYYTPGYGHTLGYTPVGLGYRQLDPDPDPCIPLKKPLRVPRPLLITMYLYP
jgi:hypothetical protein